MGEGPQDKKDADAIGFFLPSWAWELRVFLLKGGATKGQRTRTKYFLETSMEGWRE